MYSICHKDLIQIWIHTLNIQSCYVYTVISRIGVSGKVEVGPVSSHFLKLPFLGWLYSTFHAVKGPEVCASLHNGKFVYNRKVK